MKCPQCGAWSTVKATRGSSAPDGRDATRRERLCGNHHRFATLEVVRVTVDLKSQRDAQIIEAMRRGDSEADVAQQFKVHVRTVQRATAQLRRKNTPDAKQHPRKTGLPEEVQRAA